MMVMRMLRYATCGLSGSLRFCLTCMHLRDTSRNIEVSSEVITLSSRVSNAHIHAACSCINALGRVGNQNGT